MWFGDEIRRGPDLNWWSHPCCLFCSAARCIESATVRPLVLLLDTCCNRHTSHRTAALLPLLVKDKLTQITWCPLTTGPFPEWALTSSWPTMNACNSSNTSLSLNEAADITSFSLSVVFTIVHILTLGVLLFFKMYRKFIYRLLLYTLVAWTISLISWTAYLLTTIKVTSHLVELGTCENPVVTPIFVYIHAASLYFFYLLLTSMGLCLYILAIHHHQFTSWVADLIFLLVCLILSQPLPITVTVLISLNVQYTVPEMIFLALLLLANVGFTALTLVPMCCRACGYNQCMRYVATRESHRQALKEILPLFLLLTPVLSILPYLPLASYFSQWYSSLRICTTGLTLALSFALHLCFLGKTKLKKLRGKSPLLPTLTYGTNVNWPHTHRPTVFTSEGISETCNTDYHVSEDEVDRQLLHNMQ